MEGALVGIYGRRSRNFSADNLEPSINDRMSAPYVMGRSISRGLQYQLAQAVWLIEHGHVPDVRQFECGPRLVAFAIC